VQRDTELLTALAAVHAGRIARDLESTTLDFKVDGKNDDATIKSLVDAALCFANAAGGVVVLGVSNKESGPVAFVGTDIDQDYVKKRIYELSTPHLLVDVRAETYFGVRLAVLYVAQSPDIHSDAQGRAPRRISTDCLPMSSQDQTLLREERQGIDWSAQPSGRPLSDVSPRCARSCSATTERVRGRAPQPRQGQ